MKKERKKERKMRGKMINKRVQGKEFSNEPQLLNY